MRAASWLGRRGAGDESQAVCRLAELLAAEARAPGLPVARAPPTLCRPGAGWAGPGPAHVDHRPARRGPRVVRAALIGRGWCGAGPTLFACVLSWAASRLRLLGLRS